MSTARALIRAAMLFIVASCAGCTSVIVIGDVVNVVQPARDDLFVARADGGEPFVARLSAGGRVLWRWADARSSDIEALSVVGSDVFALALDCVLTRIDAHTGRTLKTAAVGAGLCRAVATNGTELVVAGAFEGQIAVGAHDLTSHGLHDIFVAKVSTDLAPLWVRQLGGVGNDLARGLSRTRDGWVLVGSILGEVPSEVGAFELAGTRLVSEGDFDALVARLDEEGNPVWARTLGGPGFDVAKAARVDAQGDLYVVGSVQGIRPRASEPAITQGHLEALFAKLSASGAVLWQRIEPSVLSWHALDLDDDGIVAVGHFDRMARLDRCAVRSAGATDALVARFDLEGHCLQAHAIGSAGSDYGYAVTWRPGGFASGGRRNRGFVEIGR